MKRFEPGQRVLALDSRETYTVVCEDPPQSGVWLVESNEGERFRKSQFVLTDARERFN